MSEKEQDEGDAFWDEHGVAIGFALPPATEMLGNVIMRYAP
jgi:hypothetical protein